MAANGSDDRPCAGQSPAAASSIGTRASDARAPPPLQHSDAAQSSESQTGLRRAAPESTAPAPVSDALLPTLPRPSDPAQSSESQTGLRRAAPESTASAPVSDALLPTLPRPSNPARSSQIPTQRSMSWEIDMSDGGSKLRGKQRQAKRAAKAGSEENKAKAAKAKGKPKRKKSNTPLDERSLNSTQSCPDLLAGGDGGNGAMPTHDPAQRKVLDVRRWFCMARPQYKASCGISSLVSVWNFLYSTLGHGDLAAITQEEVLDVLGFKPPFGEIRFGPFTGNATLMGWFQELNRHYNVSGLSSILYKPVGRRPTAASQSDALQSIKAALRSDTTALLYHCHNHYFCPIGFEDTPKLAEHAYSGDLSPSQVDTWLLIGDPSRTNQPILSARWVDVCKDLQLSSPQYYNIRHPEHGIRTRANPSAKRAGTTLHCIMAFRRTPALRRMQLPRRMPQLPAEANASVAAAVVVMSSLHRSHAPQAAVAPARYAPHRAPFDLELLAQPSDAREPESSASPWLRHVAGAARRDGDFADVFARRPDDVFARQGDDDVMAREQHDVMAREQHDAVARERDDAVARERDDIVARERDDIVASAVDDEDGDSDSDLLSSDEDSE